MTARMISEAEISKDLIRSVRDISRSMALGGTVPHPAVILGGADAASQIYVRAKERAAAECDICSTKHVLPGGTSERLVVDLIHRLNADAGVHGILVQLPLPAHIDATRVNDAIDPMKDFDGFHPYNVGRLTAGISDHHFVPCIPAGCMVLIDVGNNRIIQSVDGTEHLFVIGDVDFDECRCVASAITPVPGGVGPMTIADAEGECRDCGADMVGAPAQQGRAMSVTFRSSRLRPAPEIR